jgi:hypothetical protein
MKPKERLAILVPDGAYPRILGEFLSRRRESLAIREVAFDVIKDVFHDSSPEVVMMLRPYLRTCSHALVMRDLHGSGWDDRGAAALEAHLLQQLVSNGWDRARSAVVVVEPEVEAWLRFNSVHLQALVQEKASRRQGEVSLLFRNTVEMACQRHGGLNELGKPRQPKEVLEALLFTFGVRRSNALYERLAAVESLKGCRVHSFQRLFATLQAWFPAP